MTETQNTQRRLLVSFYSTYRSLLPLLSQFQQQQQQQPINQLASNKVSHIVLMCYVLMCSYVTVIMSVGRSVGPPRSYENESIAAPTTMNPTSGTPAAGRSLQVGPGAAFFPTSYS